MMEEKRTAPVCFDAESNLFAPEDDNHSNGILEDMQTLPNTKVILLYFDTHAGYFVHILPYTA